MSPGTSIFSGLQRKVTTMSVSPRVIRSTVRPTHVREITPSVTEPTSYLEDVPVSEIHVAEYQRKLYEDKLRRMIREWNPADVRHVELSFRENGMYFVIDGQHRIEAIRRQEGLVPQVVRAIVWVGLSVQDEAEMFWRTQDPRNRKALIPEEIHNAALFSGDPQALRIQRAVDNAGYRIGPSLGDEQGGSLRAVKHLYTIEQRYGEELLKDTLAFISQSWGVRAVPAAPMITGVALFMGTFPEARMDTLVKRVGKQTMEDWLLDAGGRSRMLKLNKSEGVASQLHADYNSVHRAKKLDDFERRMREHQAAIRSQVSRDAKIRDHEARKARMQ